MTARSLAERQARDLLRKIAKEKSGAKLLREHVFKGSALIGHEPVEATPRRAMTIARKREIHAAHDGKCICGKPVPLTGPGVTYDHRVPIWFGSPDENREVRPLCDDCDGSKTSNDQTQIAKTKRLKAEHERTEPKPPSRLKGRKFPTEYRPFPPNRGFRR